MADIRIDGARLWQGLMEMARIGATPGGGVGRIALTDLDRQGRDLFVAWCREAGCTVRIDRLGNIFARRPGRDASRPPVMTGSHLDSQPLGGRFDGVYGVLAALEVVRALNGAGIETAAPIEVAAWTDEEGVRFGGALASQSFAGMTEPEAVLAARAADGATFGEELARIGYAGDLAVGFAVDSFFEAHIEQGPILEMEGKTVGVVLGAQGQRCFAVTVDGEEGHAGTLPMTQRHDALVGVARMIDALNATAFRHAPHPVITVGRLHVRPNSPNTIPGQVIFTIDSRHPDNALLARVKDEMTATCHEIAAKSGVAVTVAETSHRQTVEFDGGCIDLVRQAAARLNLAHRDIYSAAGHDACYISRVAPTAMIFVPCEKGISHNEKENATPEDLAAGCDVLLQAVLARAMVEEPAARVVA